MRLIPFFLALIISIGAQAQEQTESEKLQQLIEKTQPFMQKTQQQSDWLTSRLQMYWYSHATDVFIRGEQFDHAGGERAPYPTVRLDGTRGIESKYNRPKLEDIVPYDDDAESNVTYISKATGKMEKAHPSKTGRNIGNINVQITKIARDAALIYKANSDKRYAKMAADVLDVFLKGIAYRNVPYDLNHGHQQTLVGYMSFEVIHEDAVYPLCETYRILKDYLKSNKAPTDIYDHALKKWAENIIANGVPHNNWNLYQAETIATIAMTLSNNAKYSDGKGREYYIDYIRNRDSIRQWSMKRLANYGFDAETGIWCESPGYSLGVINDFADFANALDRDAGYDMFSDIPQIEKAVNAIPQYLMPNRMFCGFGDSHPNYLSVSSMNNVQNYAARHGDKAKVAAMQRLKEAVAPDASDDLIQQYVSCSFYAPNVSWLVQRTGMNRNHDLMYSINGSLGNHQHANGISLELYGKGFVLAPDAGIGKYLYSGLDYSEYYSQFPAHNTVCVDGISSYPVMMSHHPFQLKMRYPAENTTGQFQDIAFSQVYFLEPESQSDQLRTVGIIKTSEQGGYYIDVFRSKKQNGGDKMHDYFYHNLGQTTTIKASNSQSLDLKPTDELAFAGGHLNAYSYLYDKRSVRTAEDIKTQFITKCEDGREITMTMWMQGSSNRDIFTALSPVNMQYERMPNQPYKIIEQPVLTFIARQYGEAWRHPFVAIYEPSDSNEPSEISKVEFYDSQKGARAQSSTYNVIIVSLKNGSTDYVFSAPEETEMQYKNISVKATFAVIRDGKILLKQ